MGLIGRTDTVQPPNNPPEWTGTPNPTWTDGVGGTYEMADDTFDQEGDALTYTLNAGSAALPTGVTISGSTLVGTSSVVTGTTTGVIIDVKDATSSLIASSSFSIVVSALNLAAFPDAEGFGTETTHGRTGIVVEVTNLNDSGAGSLREALRTESTRIVTFTVSGTIFLDTPIKMGGEHANCGVFGQTAPGDGICLGGSASLGGPLIQISNNKSTDNTIDECHDVVFQHIRGRHGNRTKATQASINDCFICYAGTYNVVLDHCSASWTGDETLSFWDNNVDDDTITSIHDITVSHCIVAEGDKDHNTGTLFSGGDDPGDTIYNITYHHNYSAHLNFRDIMVDTGSGDSTKGVQTINNVHYDRFNSYNTLGQNQYGESQTFFDAINEVFIRGSRERASGRPTFLVNRLYTLTGASWTQTDDGIFHDVSLYVTGSIFREVGLGTISSRVAGEADNTLWIEKQYVGLTGGGGPYDDGETFVTRGSQFTTQPTNPVTTTTALQAYTDLITNGDCGALPHDSVDARIVASVGDGTVFSGGNVPGPGSADSAWPTLTDTGARTDTSGNGLPDSYQVGVLGKSAGDTYNPANTFTVGNGYSDIENWIHTL